jgi:[protein-PII] uridylyltransferase
VDDDSQVRHATFVRAADERGARFAFEVRPMAFEGATEITILAPDHPRLLSTIAGACAASDANIVDAQIFTTTDGRALDTVIVSRAFDEDADEARRGERIARLIEQVLEGRVRLGDAVAPQAPQEPAQRGFHDRAAGTRYNELSDRFTVVEVECLDRHGLLYDLTHGISDLSLDIASAHIATFGERVVDTFYVTDLTGHRVTAKPRQNRIRRACRRHRRRAPPRTDKKPREPRPRLSSRRRQHARSRILGFAREMMIAATLGTGRWRTPSTPRSVFPTCSAASLRRARSIPPLSRSSRARWRAKARRAPAASPRRCLRRSS